MTPKQQIQWLLSQLPEDCTFQEIQDHLNSYGGTRSRPSSERFRAYEERDGARAYAEWQSLVSI